MSIKNPGCVVFSQLGFYGRSSNIMYEIATVIATAKRYECDYLIPNPIPHMSAGNKEMISPDYKLYFMDKLSHKLVNADWIRKYPHKFHYIHETTDFKEIDLSEGLAHDPHCIYDLRGYFQSEKYFKNAEAEIRELFSLDRFKPQTQSHLEAIRRTANNKRIIGVGIRLTDYLEAENFYHNLTKTDYYQKAFEYFAKKDDCTFLIFSDDIELARVRIKEMGLDKYTIRYAVNKDHPIDGFALMAACDGIIMANSTFHFWSAWLGKMETVAPKLWYVRPDFTANDLYTDDMILM